MLSIWTSVDFLIARTCRLLKRGAWRRRDNDDIRGEAMGERVRLNNDSAGCDHDPGLLLLDDARLR